jgi:hypothetical protein
MKFQSALVAVTVADIDPLKRLDTLVRFGQEWVEQNIPNAKSVQTGKWQAKWETNAGRMRAAYERCGTKPEARKRRQIERFEDWTVSDDDLFASTERYNRQDPESGIRDITTGFRKWAFRYLNECNGQTQNQLQKIRMEKWRTTLTAKFLYFKAKMTADE